MSCNGCRVLRKGCTQNCIIRPCLQWIKSPDSQANATLFLAKFYGRAGLLNLIEAGPENLRPAIFRSLLYEACGRVVNPVYGSVGVLYSGNWVECQAAVDAVLRGSQITQTSPPPPPESFSQQPISPLKTYDIRHVFKVPNAAEIDKVRTRARFKRSAPKRRADSSSVDGKEDESMFSVETVEGSLVNRSKKGGLLMKFANQTEESTDIGLELTLDPTVLCCCNKLAARTGEPQCNVVTIRTTCYEAVGTFPRRVVCLVFQTVGLHAKVLGVWDFPNTVADMCFFCNKLL
ncbi:hypothetical protein V6N13_069532 [Hibiscus sabdariffa]